MLDFIKQNKVVVIVIIAALAVLGFVMFMGNSGDGDATKPAQNENTVDTMLELENITTSGTLLYPKTNDDFRYNVYDTYIEITECISTKDAVTVPATLEDLPVLIIRPQAFTNSLVSSVNVSNGVVYIDGYAFAEAENLLTVTLPDSVFYIGEYAFSSAEKLTSVALGNGVKELGASAFLDCIELSNITIPESVTTLGEGCFDGCASLLEIVIPNTVLIIPDNFCRECISLKSITIQESDVILDKNGGIEESDANRSIGSFAFSGCESLTSVWIPKDVTVIDEDAFSHASNTLTVFGYTSSPAAIFAAQNRIDFVVLDNVDGYQKISNTLLNINSQLIEITNKYLLEDKDEVPAESVATYVEEIKTYVTKLKNNGVITGYSIMDNEVTIVLSNGVRSIYSMKISDSYFKEAVING